MPSKPVKRQTFKESLIAKIDEYMDKAFATKDEELRQRYRDVIREMEHLLLTISNLE